MGNPSYLRFVPSSCATTPIDWTKVPEASKKVLLKNWPWDFYSETDTQSTESEADTEDETGTEDETDTESETDTGSDSDSEETRPLPPTIGDLAKWFHDYNFFGYMTEEVCTLLLDISEFGLTQPCRTKTVGFPVGPRFYMKAVNQVCFILFVPGSRDGITGYSPKITYTKDEDKDGGIAHDKALAEDYDMKLSEEVRRIRTAGAVARKKVAGWQSSTLKSTLQDEQMYEVILKLPEDHPAYVAMMQGVRRAIYG